jgi:hypothetical protein
LLLSQILGGLMHAGFFGDGEDFFAGPYQVGNLHWTLPTIIGRILGLFLVRSKMGSKSLGVPRMNRWLNPKTRLGVGKVL